MKGYGCPGHSIMTAAIAAVEIARVDGSMSTFVLVHTFLAVLTIGAPHAKSCNIRHMQSLAVGVYCLLCQGMRAA